MKKIIGISAVVLAMTLLTLNVLAAETKTATATASATVLGTCGIEATGIGFGDLVPGQTYTNDNVYSTISMPTGNQVVTPYIKGVDWTDGGTNTFGVGQTHWSLTSTTLYGSMTALTIPVSDDGDSLEDTVSHGDPLEVYFKLSIPAGQVAASYTQTITFTVSC